MDNSILDVIDLTKESPTLIIPSRSRRRNVEDVSSSHGVTESPDRSTRIIPPIVLGSSVTTYPSSRRKRILPHVTTFSHSVAEGLVRAELFPSRLTFESIYAIENPRRENIIPRATSSNEVLTLDDTVEEDKPFYTVESDDKKPIPLTCPICLESLSSNLKPTTTQCGHLFCAECLETFLHTSKKCPTCKRAITLKSCTRLYL